MGKAYFYSENGLKTSCGPGRAADVQALQGIFQEK
jgi:hypothetical protein